LSTWLKSGFTVPSSVTVEVTPYLTLAPRSPFERGSFHADAASRVWLCESVALGITSSRRGWRSSSNISGTFDSNTHLPGGIPGHDHDIPDRLMRRKNMTPISTFDPPRKRLLSSGTLP